jgi:hypothetical protein
LMPQGAILVYGLIIPSGKSRTHTRMTVRL